MNSLLAGLEQKSIIDAKGISILRNHISLKYSSLPSAKRAIILADALNKVFDARLPGFESDMGRKLRRLLIENALKKSSFAINCLDVFQTAVELNESGNPFFDCLETWLAQNTPQLVPKSKLVVLVQEARRRIELDPEKGVAGALEAAADDTMGGVQSSGVSAVSADKPEDDVVEVFVDKPKAEAVVVSADKPEASAVAVSADKPETEAVRATVVKPKPDADVVAVAADKPEAEAVVVLADKPEAEAVAVTAVKPKADADAVEAIADKPEAEAVRATVVKPKTDADVVAVAADKPETDAVVVSVARPETGNNAAVYVRKKQPFNLKSRKLLTAASLAAVLAVAPFLSGLAEAPDLPIGTAQLNNAYGTERSPALAGAGNDSSALVKARDSSSGLKADGRHLKMKATAYDLSVQSCGKLPDEPGYGITRSGTKALVGRTVAVDSDVIPLGSKVRICFPDEYSQLNGIYIAEDTGNLIKGNSIDIFFGEDKRGSTKVFDSAMEFGVRYVEVTVLDDPAREK